MDQLQAMRILVAVGDSGGFASAARQLGLSPPVVTRSIMALEAQIGVPMLQRTTRSVRLTEVGERYLADCRRILAELDEAQALATGAYRQPQGLLAVTAPSMFGRLHVLPLVLEFLRAHDSVTARTFFIDRLVHLIDEGFDVAVRIAQLPDSGLTAVPVGRMRAVVVASPDYLARCGVPRSPGELVRHQTIGVARDAMSPNLWGFQTDANVTLSPRLVVNTPEAAVATAVQGYGLARALYYQVIEPVRDGKLQLVLESDEPPAVPVHVVYPAGRKAAAKVRAFVDLAVDRLRASEVMV